MTIEQYLTDDAFCRMCGQGFRENFTILIAEATFWHIECHNCLHEFTITQEFLDRQ